LAEETGVTESTIRMLSSIGRSVTDPEAVHIEKTGDADPAQVEEIVKECLADWEGVRDRLIDGKYELY
jgi:S-adenosylmethionine synthetase